ncbi:hypothetical protein DFH06DRAFT_268843 [Mycena polygramma]|nr:hypothetical protein DFH06DRAFT_268843 [Mycena polygramma]
MQIELQKLNNLDALMGDNAATRMAEYCRYVLALTHYLRLCASGYCFPQDNEAFNDELEKDFSVIESVVWGISALRGRAYPPPAEREWAALIDELVGVATAKYRWAITSPRSEPSPRAMPRSQTGTEEVYLDHKMAPSTFKPDRAYSMPRITSTNRLSPRIIKCLGPAKERNWELHLPIGSVEYKASIYDMPQAEGQSTYSAVQAALIYQQADVTSLKHLSLSIAYGHVRPMSSHWPGAGSPHDIVLCTGDTLDLARLEDAVSVYIMLKKNIRTHIEAAFSCSPEKLANGALSYPWPHVGMTPRDLVDWRTLRVPPSVLKKKRKSEGGAKASPKRQKSVVVTTFPVEPAEEDIDEGESDADSSDAETVVRRRV